MPLKLWLATVAVLVLSAEVTGRCEDQISIKFKALIGHTFKTWLTGNPYQCHLKCQDDMRCQSFNFVIRNGGCEMNNQTMETRPKDLIDDNERFYMKRWPKGEGLEESNILSEYGNISYINALKSFLGPVTQYGKWVKCYRAMTDGWNQSRSITDAIIKDRLLLLSVLVNTSLVAIQVFHGRVHQTTWTILQLSFTPCTTTTATILKKWFIARASGSAALYDASNCGPTFGGGHDMRIRNMASSYSDSYYLCSTYKCSSFPLTDSQKYFTPNDVEVLYATNS
ncbi:hypothetical protein OS493_019502 [Desmophyllum pertusum]|uniref:Apple domain-containing protein n=1 Tax=Desmophyllum pertusum TaxID=174260 RepID=A0A9X0D2T3_9CNID|nr:hypothetical protein OS493_019502 [Desmophyllum pertusum]